MPVSVLDALADTGATDETNPGSFAVSAGNDRYLGVVQHAAGDADTITALSWGGQPLTQREAVASAGGFPSRIRIWTLDEAGIAAATGSAFSVTGSINGDFRLSAVTLQDVDQTNPIVDTGTAVVDGSSIGDIILTTVDGGYALAGIMWDDADPPDPVAWGSPFTDRVNLSTGFNRHSAADLLTTGVSETVSATTGADTQQAMAAISFRSSTTAVQASASGGVIFGGSAGSSLTKLASASGSVTFSGRAGALRDGRALTDAGDVRVLTTGDRRVIRSLTVLVEASASGSVSFDGAARGSRALPGSASAEVGFAGAARGIRVKPASAAAQVDFSGAANGSPFSGARATGLVDFGGRANASPPIPLIPVIPLEQSVLNAQRPIFLVDLLFEGAEVNIWTRGVEGEFAGKEYRPLGGIDSGITILNSLQASSLDASIQISGQSQEMLSIALTENYRGRTATVYLANLGADNKIEAVEVLLPGKITNMTVSDNDEESVVSVVIQSIFRGINRPETRRLSASDLSLRSADDSFFDRLESTERNEPRFGGG